MTFLHRITEYPITVSIILILAVVGAFLIDDWSERRNAEDVIYHGEKQLKIRAILIDSALMFGWVSTLALALILATGCSTEPKHNTIPLQSAPAKAEKTTIQTWTDFFESRD